MSTGLVSQVKEVSQSAIATLRPWGETPGADRNQPPLQSLRGHDPTGPELDPFPLQLHLGPLDRALPQPPIPPGLHHRLLDHFRRVARPLLLT
ncbi:unnamed protein product [Prunus armeniaca]|uniref:Uncharacterized protein n=1 Tax=Prunus armeniaca TaxID=36596 RepID=A0A6J5VV40_PRUAR|nr:unnamed protein product [Prunus armeniaca]